MAATVLLVDDDDSFSVLLGHVMKKTALAASLQYVECGEDAIEYLSGIGRFADRRLFPFPAVMLLDLKMPRMSGFDVLAWKSKQSALKSLPVVIWSSSAMDADRKRAHDLGAVSYYVKPIEFDGLVDLVNELGTFCFEVKPQKPSILDSRHGLGRDW